MCGVYRCWELMEGFKRVLLPDTNADEFSDIYAQTLTYGMFAARLHDDTPEDFSREEAARLIPKSNPFLRKLFNHINSDIEDEIKWPVDDIVRLFAVADVRFADGKVYINDGQYFDHVNEADFGFFIGGYQPAQKWLKDRKGRTLANEDIDHYQAIVLAISRTRALMQKLSALSKEWLG